MNSSTATLSAADKRALLARLLVEKASRPERFPLSFAQQRLWFLHQLDPDSAAYNIQLALSLRGDLRWEAFSAGLQEIVRRHKILRTTFEEVDQQPTQLVSQVGTVAAPVADLQGLQAGAQEREVGRLAAEVCHLAFDLRRGPLLRIHLLRRGSADWVLLIALHHIVADGWSLAVFLGELAALYGAFAAGRPSPLAELTLQYGDFAQRQLQQLQGDALEGQLRYWKDRLGDRPPVLELPTDRPRPAVRTAHGGSRFSSWRKELRDCLAALSQGQGATLFMTLLAGLKAALQAHTGQRDIAVGSPITGRNRRELQGLIGLFVNTLVFRTDLSGDPSFRQLLQRVRAVALGAYAHQDLPFEKLVRELQIERDLSRTPLFQVMLAWQDAPPSAVELPGVASQPLPIAAAATKFDLNLEVRPGMRGLGVYAEYDRDVFDPATIDRLLGRCEILLEAVAAEPDAPLSALPLLAASERHQLLAEWNDTNVRTATGAEPEEALLHRLLEAQVDRTPAATAVVFADERLTYWELDRRANTLAWRLRELGCGPESTIGIFLERSLELIISLYAVLKSGASYVPLDPDLPAERLLYQARSAGLAVILGQERLCGRLPAAGCPLLVVDGFRFEEGDGRPPVPALAADHPAYVLFTSGSTGRPKGVVVSHRAIVNRLIWMQEAYRLTPVDRVLQKTPASFDVSVWEFFWPLLTGSALVVARPGGHRDNGYLVRLIAEEGITFLHFVPSMLQMFLEEPGVECCRSLRDVVASGEALPAELAQRFHDRLPARLHNLYGPTEAAVDVTSHRCERQPRQRGVPIGRPITRTRIHLLAPDLRPTPIGVVGELYIGGVNLARGYIGRPDLTAERFLPDPLQGEPGARLYRTGDLARYRVDGALEYRGRTDHQVKVRGFRIELGEIEACLAQHPGLREAAVVTWRGQDDHPRLAAYTVAAGAAAPQAEELRRFLGQRLPDYMVPALYVTLDRLPLNSSGKLDRRALPEPAARPALTERFASPEGAAEETLAEIWSRVLGVERVGRDDNFFTLGGDSILSLKVLSLARQRGLPLSLPQIFRFPTVRGLAEAAAETRPSERAAAATASVGAFALISEADRRQMPEGVEDAYPLARLQAGMLFHSELAPETAVYHDIFNIYLEAPLDPALLRRAGEHVAALHPALRTTFDLATFSEPLQLVHRTMEIDLSVDDIRHLDEPGQREYLAAWMATEKVSPLDWSRGPLVRFRIFPRSAQGFQLILSFHHAALDGWSVAALMTELLHTYFALRRGGEPPTVAPAGSYRQFVALERLAVESAESRSYWRERLADADFAAVARCRPAAPGAQGSGLFEMSLDPLLSERIVELARGWGVPVKSVLLAAHCRVHAVLSGRDRLVTGLVVNGRPEEEGGERVLGLFLNSLPLCVDLAGSSWRELVQRVFASERELLAHRRFPLADLQRGAGAPLFEMVFNFVHFHVYQALAGFSEIRAARSEFFEQTNFPLLASFSQGAFSSRLYLRLEYDPREFPPQQITAIAHRYERALAALAAGPYTRFDAEPPFSAAERHQLLWEWNDTAVPYPLDPCVHSLVETRARRSPDAIAAVCGGGYLTYGELARAADRLAHRLRALGCGPEVLVAVVMERSVELVVTLLGVLKAGAAYVPLDPDSPSDRLAAMLADARPGALVSQEHVLPRLPAAGPALICQDPEVGAGEPVLPAYPIAPSDPSSLAYMIYTSGSTGSPKGALVPHRGLANRLDWMQDALRLGPEDVVLQKTPFTFDVSVWEFFWPLLVGARLVLARPGGHREAPYLIDLVAREAVTVLHFVPSMLQSFLEEPEVEDCRSLRLVVASGEALSPELERRFFERSGAELYNLYGPTEASIDVSCWRCTPGGHQFVPLGRPIANTSLYVLDHNLLPVPVGAPGELAIGGVNVGRGYLGRPDLTAERFVPDPWGEPGARLYRTGDLARLAASGVIEFLGRIDHQVKIRGFRIEPGEIEALLARHPAVREAVVTVREDLPGGRGIAAYFVPREGSAPSTSELRTMLRRTLPDYMIPAAFVPLAALPLNANGKLDRKALPAPQTDPALPAAAFVAPRDPVEQLVARIWCQVLGIERVSVQQNFFEIGGHSLLATQVVARLRRTFGIKLPLRTFFERPTVAELAREVTTSSEWAGQSGRILRARQALEGLSAEQVKERLHATRRAGGTVS